MIDISLIKIFGYGLGNLSFGIIVQVISSFMTFFGTSVLGVSGTSMGVIVFIGVLWDAVTDPIMGYISDHTSSVRFGKRQGYVLFGCIFLAVSNVVLWSVRPEYSMISKILLLGIFLLLCKTFSTVYATPYSALGAELSEDYDERTKIQGVKSLFFLLGLAMPTVLGVYIFFKPTEEYALGQLNPDVYLPLGIATSVVSLICGLLCVVATWDKRVYEKKKNGIKFSAKAMMKEMISPMLVRESRYVILGYLCQNIATAIVMTLNLHIFTYTFRLASADISLIMATLLLCAMVAQPFWVKRATKKDKKRAIIESIVLAIIGCVIFGGLVAVRSYIVGKGLVFLPFAAVVGFAMGGMICIPQTMIIDTIDLEEYETGKRKEGSTFGCMTLFYKLSQAITLFFLVIYLDLIGFDSSVGMQSANVDGMLGFSLPIGVILSLGLTMLCFSKYSLNKEKVKEIQKKLKEQNTSF